MSDVPSLPPFAALARHMEAVQACRRCPRMIGPPVVGRPVNHGILLIGQAPGEKEPRLRRPFAWTAGKTLFQWFRNHLGWTEEETRDRIYFSALCRCFPGKKPGGGDRMPAAEEIENCRPWLEAEFALIRPRLVLLVGKMAIVQFLQLHSLDEAVGRLFSLHAFGHRTDCIPLPHPSGASTWPRVEPGKSLLRHAMERIAAHPAVKAAAAGPSRTISNEGCHPPVSHPRKS
ncbi:MAG: uracil-DNA glycosylase [Opitutaceae bacterium]|nr:uracil-DNA glycosylase [Opitutaceae bacterium]